MALVQHVGKNTGVSSSTTLTVAAVDGLNATAVGNHVHLVLLCRAQTTIASSLSISDGTHTWTQRTPLLSPGANAVAAIFDVISTTASITSITVTANGTAGNVSIDADFFEYNDANVAALAVNVFSTTGNSTAPSLAGAPSAAAGYAIAGIGQGNNSSMTGMAGSPGTWTVEGAQSGSPTGAQSLQRSLIWTINSTSTQTVSATIGQARAWAVAIVYYVSLGATLSASSAATATLSRPATRNHTISAASTATAALSTVTAHLWSMTAASPAVATLSRTANLIRTLSASSAATAGLSRVASYLRTLSAPSAATASLSRTASLTHTLSAASAAVASMNRTAARNLTLTAVSAASATVTRSAIYRRTMAASSAATATLIRSTIYARTLSAASPALASLAHAIHNFYTGAIISSTPVATTPMMTAKQPALTPVAAKPMIEVRR